jgi:hypothetical protein
MSRHHVQNMQHVYGNVYAPMGSVLLGYGAITGSMVRAQIKALNAGQFVPTPMAAIPQGERNRSRTGATSTGQAAMKAAYWIAVLGRANRDQRLASVAQRFYREGSGNDRSVAAIRRVFDRALVAIQNQKGRWAAYVRATLGAQATQTQSAQRVEREQGGIVTRAIAAADSEGRLTTALEEIPVVGGKDPKKGKRKAIGIGVGLAAVLGLIGYVVYARPAIKRGRAAYDRTKRKAQAAVSAARSQS